MRINNPVTQAAGATTVTITNDTTTNATVYPVWVSGTSGNQSLEISSTKLSFNPSTGAFNISGPLTASSLNKFVFTAPATSATINTRADNLTHSLPPVSGNLALEQLIQNSQSADYTTVLNDAGKDIFHPSSDNNARTFTIDSNANVAYPLETLISFTNMSATSISIAITSDTMYLAGTAITGTRTLAQNGIAVARKVATTTWLISGVGLS